MKNVVVAVLLCLAGLAPASVGAQIAAEDAWIREAPPTAPVRAGYLQLVNTGDDDLRVVSVASAAFGAVEIHEMVDRDDGAMRMRPVEAIEVAAGSRVELAPGGLHLMLFRPQRVLATGDRVQAELVLDDGTRIAFELEQR